MIFLNYPSICSDQRLNGMKRELEEIQRERECQLKALRAEYENFQVSHEDFKTDTLIYSDSFSFSFSIYFQVVIQRAIDKIDFGEKRIHMMRDKFLSEMLEFNENFDFPKEKLDEIFNSAIKQKQTKPKTKSSVPSSYSYFKS